MIELLTYQHPHEIPCMWPFGCERMAYGYDHNHDTDVVRAALCGKHNAALGTCGDQPESLRVLASWLETANMGFTYGEYRKELKTALKVRRMSVPELVAHDREANRAYHAHKYATDSAYRERAKERRRIKRSEY